MWLYACTEVFKAIAERLLPNQEPEPQSGFKWAISLSEIGESLFIGICFVIFAKI
jgi:hypothetical protein